MEENVDNEKIREFSGRRRRSREGQGIFNLF